MCYTFIVPIKGIFEHNNKTKHRCGYPLQLAYALSTYKSQGQTIDKTLVDLDKQEYKLGATIVAASRTPKWEHLWFRPYICEPC